MSQSHNQNGMTLVLELEGSLLCTITRDSTTRQLFNRIGSIADNQRLTLPLFDRTCMKCENDSIIVLRPGARKFLHRQLVAGNKLGVWSKENDTSVLTGVQCLFRHGLLKNHLQWAGLPHFVMGQKHSVRQRNDMLLCTDVVVKRFANILTVCPNFDTEQAILFDTSSSGVAEHQFVRVPSFQLIHPGANETTDQIIARLAQDTYLCDVSGTGDQADIDINRVKATTNALKPNKITMKQQKLVLRAQSNELKARRNELKARIADMEATERARKVPKTGRTQISEV